MKNISLLNKKINNIIVISHFSILLIIYLSIILINIFNKNLLYKIKETKED